MRAAPSLLSLLLLLAPTLVAAQSDEPDTLAVDGLAAGAPDGELDLVLEARFRSGALADEPLHWSLSGSHTPANATEAVTWTAAEGDGVAAPDGAAWNATVRALYGPGAYRFTLQAAGPRLANATASLDVDVPEVRNASAAVNFTLDAAAAPPPPPDASQPTSLRFASDSVNADGKTKTPGVALITRVYVADADGLADVRSVTFAYFRDAAGERVPVATRVVAQPGANLTGSPTQVLVEDRFDFSPMKDGAYVCRITADGTPGGNATLERTFVLQDVQPDATLALAPSVLPLRAGTLAGELTVSDRNFGTGPLDLGDVRALPLLRLALFSGSSRVSEAGWAIAAGTLEGASLDLDLRGEGARSTAFRYEALNGTGRLHVPVTVRVPEAAPAGTYRLSVALNGTLASASFDVLPVPRVLKVWLNGTALPGDALALAADVSGADAVQDVAIQAPWGTLLVPAAAHVEATLVPPADWVPGPDGNLTVLARVDGDRVLVDTAGVALNARTVPLPSTNAPPLLLASLAVSEASIAGDAWLHPGAAGKLKVRVRASDANAPADVAEELGPIEVRVLDAQGRDVNWTGTGAWPPTTRAFALTPPPGAERGRYTIALHVADVHGAEARTALFVNLGMRFRLEVAAENGTVAFAPEGEELAARVLVRNAGNSATATLAVQVEGLPAGVPAEVRLTLADGSLLRSKLAKGFTRFEAALLPGQEAPLVLALDTATLPKGVFRGRIVVAGEAS